MCVTFKYMVDLDFILMALPLFITIINSMLVLANHGVHLQWKFVGRQIRCTTVSQIGFLGIQRIKEYAIALARDSEQGFQFGCLEFVLQKMNRMEWVSGDSRNSPTLTSGAWYVLNFALFSGQLRNGMPFFVYSCAAAYIHWECWNLRRLTSVGNKRSWAWLMNRLYCSVAIANRPVS